MGAAKKKKTANHTCLQKSFKTIAWIKDSHGMLSGKKVKPVSDLPIFLALYKKVLKAV